MRALILVLLFIGINATAATVYRSVDDKGTVQYTDRPEGKDVERVVVRTKGTASTPTSRPSVAAQQAANSGKAEGSEPAIEAEQGPTEEEVQANKENNCRIAKQRLETYVTSRRLYRELPDGERDYLNDDQLTEAREKAANDVQEWCN